MMDSRKKFLTTISGKQNQTHINYMPTNCFEFRYPFRLRSSSGYLGKKCPRHRRCTTVFGREEMSYVV